MIPRNYLEGLEVVWHGAMVTPQGKGALLPEYPSKPYALTAYAPGYHGVSDLWSKKTNPWKPRTEASKTKVREAMRAKRAQQRAARRKALAESFARG